MSYDDFPAPDQEWTATFFCDSCQLWQEFDMSSFLRHVWGNCTVCGVGLDADVIDGDHDPDGYSGGEI